MSIDALTQAKSTLEGVRGALGIYSKTEVDMTLGMLDRAIAKYTDLDAICQDLQEKTYTQAMRIAELEALAKQEQRSDSEQLGEPDDLMIAYMSGLHDGKKAQKRTWVGLTDEEQMVLLKDSNGKTRHWLVWQVEAKLKEKNT